MNPFRPLLKLLDFVLGHDLHERAEPKQPQVRRPPRRSSAPQGDGFEAGSRGPRVDLRGGVKAPPKLPDEPAGPPAVIEPNNFNASLDDLSQLVNAPPFPRGGEGRGEGQPDALDFSHVVDQPLEAQPEFLPPGGMSTESLMSEFASLDAETQAAAVELAAARELAASIELENPEKFVDSFETSPASVVVAPIAPLDPAPAPPSRPVADAATLNSTAQLMGETAPAALDFSHVVDAPMEAKPEFVPEGGMSTESLMSEFASLDAETQAAAVAQAAAQEAALAAEEEEAESEGASTATRQQELLTPAWLIPATTAAPKRAVPPPAMATESLMSEFESLAPETQQAAIDEAAAKERAQQEAEAKKAQEALAPRPAAQGEGVQTPSWLLPAASPAPKRNVPAPPPAMATESLMSEFESLTPETQQGAVDEAAAKELARREAEEAKKHEVALAPHPDPLPAPQGEGVQTPAWLLPATSPAPKRNVPVPPPAMATESLMSEFDSLAPETQQAAIDEAAARELARQKAEEAKKAKEEVGPLPDPLPRGERED